MPSVPLPTAVFAGKELAAYGFGDQHPFGTDRHDVYHAALRELSLDERVDTLAPEPAGRRELEWFHTPAYVERVITLSGRGQGWLDEGDTPAFAGVFEAAATVVGTSLKATRLILEGSHKNAFVPIGGLHHAAREHAAGFCVFNDCGVVIEHLLRNVGMQRVAYVDIDAHHGDGVQYGFADNPAVIFADIHEDGRYLYPGTGAENERGTGAAEGHQLNVCLPPGAEDDEFLTALNRVEAHLRAHEPEFLILQCGADAMAGDPITHLNLSETAYAEAARRVLAIANDFAGGRVLGLGGGGYNRDNIAKAWIAVTRELALARR